MLIGIDLGTTNSAAAYWGVDGPVLIPNALGNFLTPSAVSFDEDGALLVGNPALDRQVTHPEKTATNFKRLMGTKEQISLGDKSFTPEELSSFVLSSLVRDAEIFLGEKVTGAIVTVPAYFNDHQRKATRVAGQLAGLKIERLINEPTAAALAHGIHEMEVEEPFLIFDLGGGTFDVSLVEIFDGIIEVRSSTGDNRLGGEDFNEIVAKLGMDVLDSERNMQDRDDIKFREILRSAAEKVRRALTRDDVAQMHLSWKGENYQTVISAVDFERESADLIERLRIPVRRALNDAKIQPNQLGKIILVGGATRMRIVRRTVAKMFGCIPDISLDPDRSIALGAAVQAGLQSRDAALEEVRLTDVAPYSLGIEIGDRRSDKEVITGLFQPLIERNSVVPASKVQTFSPMEDGQLLTTIKIYQGESRWVSQNIFLGELPVYHESRLSAAQASFDVRFSYDISGLLEIDVFVHHSRQNIQLVIQNGEENLSEADIVERRKELAKIKIHPRENSENVAILARLERIYEETLADQREYVGGLLSQYMQVLNAQDDRTIRETNADLIRIMNGLEGERIL